MTEAVLRSHREGILTHASLMVAEPAAGEAVRRLRRECPRLRLGLHAVLCAGRSCLGRAGLGDLVDADGSFPGDPIACGWRYYFDRGAAARLEAELRAQFERFLAWGLEPSHVDGHLNIHVHPSLLPILLRLCREYGFKRLRLPGGEILRSFRHPRGPAVSAVLQGALFGALRSHLLRSCDWAGVRTPDRVWGLLWSGLMVEDYVARCLADLPAGLSEIYLHPSSDPATRVDRAPTADHRTVTELETLLSVRVREAAAASGAALGE